MGCLLLLDLKSFKNLPLTSSTSEMKRNASTSDSSHSSHSSLIEECFHNNDNVNVNVNVNVSVNQSAATASIFEIVYPKKLFPRGTFSFAPRWRIMIMSFFQQRQAPSAKICLVRNPTASIVLNDQEHDDNVPISIMGTHREEPCTHDSLTKIWYRPIHLGSRWWEDPELEMECHIAGKGAYHPSYFVPHHCDLPPHVLFRYV
jgi:hypothetical protein